MKKHAYLIMAHKDFSTLMVLLRCIDDEKNDLYLHIDKKSKQVPWKEIHSCISKANLYIMERYSIRWGSYSQINEEIALLKAAIKRGPYAYYHLLSGNDLPLKPQEQIHEFFDQHQGTEFISFMDDAFIQSRHCYERIKYYTFFQGFSKHPNTVMRWCFEIFHALSIHAQMLLHIDRNRRQEEQLAFGANWFSITNQLAKYVVDHEDWIKQRFRFTRCADEMFLQMLVLPSGFYEHIYQKEKQHTFSNPAMRRIDWERGNPYVFTYSDKEDLRSTPNLFARKFSSSIDRDIIAYVKKILCDCDQ